jgi:serine/threonine-protein kinase
MICPTCQTENPPFAERCQNCATTLVAPTAVVVTVDLAPGTVFHDRYEILGALGRGGMGMVYKARDRALDETVAIKVLRPDFSQDPTMAERFKSEIRLARKVRHRNVCAIHDFGEERGLQFISMELVEGMDLKRLLRERGALPLKEAYELAIQVAEGLQAVHEAGIIHRDLKTPNVMRDPAGHARLMDFGIAKRQGGETLTATGSIVGTPEYMSPEQAQGHKADFRSDIYSLGIVTYELFTGQTPFRGETPISTILKQINDPPPLDTAPALGLPAELRTVLHRALAKDPAQRYQTAQAFAEALRDARRPSHRQVPASTEALRAPTVLAPGGARGRSGPSRWLLGAAAVAVVGVGVVIFALGRGRAPVPPSAEPTLPPSTVVAPGPTSPATVPVTTVPAATPTPTPVSTPTPRATATPRPPAPPATAPVTTIPVTTVPATVAPARTPLPDGTLLVVARPWGEVSVDGRTLGETPLQAIPLSPGTHTVSVRHPAYQPIERQVRIRSGRSERLLVDFPKDGVRKQ